MDTIQLEKIILGHNPFFGVDHLSQKQGDIKALKFESTKLIEDVLLHAANLGVNAMMMSTHPRSEIIIKIIKNNPRLSDFKIYPLLPYIRKYVTKSNEKGLLNVLIDTLGQASLSQKFSIMMDGAKGVLGKDIDSIIRALIDVESLSFRGLNIGAFFVHDAITDLALGLGMESLLETFRNHVENKYGVPAGFITKNIDNFRKKVELRGWEDYLVMGSINKTGFFVNPSLETAINAIERPGMSFIAMSTLSGGAIKPKEAYEFLGNISSIKSIVVGMSNKEHVTETVSAINRYIS
jgi:hypothetical protein